MTRKVHEGKTTPGATADEVFAEPPPPEPVRLEGEHAAAYAEFRAAAADLEGKVQAADAAKQRFQAALGRFTRLTTGIGAIPTKPG